MASGRADPLERLAGGLFVGLPGEIAEADDADEPFLVVDYRQPAHLGLAHLAGDILDMLVGVSRDDSGRHQFAD